MEKVLPPVGNQELGNDHRPRRISAIGNSPMPLCGFTFHRLLLRKTALNLERAEKGISGWTSPRDSVTIFPAWLVSGGEIV